MPNRVGQKLGHYQLVRLLGRGGFAEVYLGEHLYLKRYAALKILNAQLTSGDLQDFLKEAQAIASLKHPNIISVLDFGIDSAEQTPYLVMDYAPNGTLRQHHPKGSILPLSTVVTYVKQVAAALNYAHEHKLIHCDIKPENMLLDNHNNILLSDFGIAATAHSTTSLKTQAYAGTVHYSAPEQIQGKPRIASDQYALAAVVYEWLTGKVLFDGGQYIAIAMQHLTSTPEPLRARVPTISSEVEQVVLTALSKMPEKRFKDIRAFATALEQASQSIMFPNAQIGTTFFIYLHHKSTVSVLAWSPNNQYIASGDENGGVHIWESIAGTPYLTYSSPQEIVALKWSPDSKQVASINRNGQLQVWELATKKVLSTHNVGTLDHAAWSLDGRRIAIVSKNIWIIDAATGRRIVACSKNPTNFRDMKVAWSPDGKSVASVDNLGGFRVRDATTDLPHFPELPHPLVQDPIDDCCVAWSLNGSLIACGIYDSYAQLSGLSVLRAITQESVFHHNCITFDVAWAPDNAFLVSASLPPSWGLFSSREDKVQAWVWNITSGEPIYTYGEHSESVTKVSWSPNGAYIASASRDNAVHVWQAK